MKILDNPEYRVFREECRAWLTDNTPRETRPPEGEAMRQFDLDWQRKQYDGGWAGVSWPEQYGGRGLSVFEQLIWHEEYARAGAPPSGSMFVALSHAGPTLIVCGTDEQRAKYLEPILKGEENWCQGFSEPGAGSDLASLRCKAEIDGDHLVVNGTKIWTSYGHLANRQELLVRTNPAEKRHRGITWVICDMDAPGIDIRPIKAMSGLTHFAQVFYDNVRIPLANVVGEVNEGWKTTLSTLGFERGTGTIPHQMELSRKVDELIETAKSLGKSGGDDLEITRAELAQLKAEAAALRSLTAAQVARGATQAVPGPEGNIVALYYGELTRRVHAATVEILGAAGLLRTADHNLPVEYLESFKWAIGGGTSEIRRNVIAERILGMPKVKVSL